MAIALVTAKKIAPTDNKGAGYLVTNHLTGKVRTFPYDYSADDAALAAVEAALTAEGVLVMGLAYEGYRYRQNVYTVTLA